MFKTSKGVFVGLLLVAAALVGGSFLGNQLINAMQSPEREFDAAAKKQIADFRQSESVRLKALREADDKALAPTMQRIKLLSQDYQRDVQNATIAAQQITRDAERDTDAIIATHQKFIDQLRDASNR